MPSPLMAGFAPHQKPEKPTDFESVGFFIARNREKCNLNVSFHCAGGNADEWWTAPP